MTTFSPLRTISFLLIVLFTTTIVACGLGFFHISSIDVIQIFLSHFTIFSNSNEIDSTAKVVLLDVRLPRILCALLVGGCLAVTGCVFQAVLLNPLADPYTLGVSSGAAFGAALSIVLTLFGLSAPSQFFIPTLAFIGAITTLFIVFKLSSGDHQFGSNTLILSGVIVAAILSAGIGFLKYLADEQVNVIIFWLMGSLTGKSWNEVYLLFFTALPLNLLLFYYAREMNILSFGQKTANSLGVDAIKSRKILLTTASMLTAICVSISGIIGFIGLIIPHLLRRIVGADNRVLLPASFLGGALLLLIADTITRAILPNEVPIGILTSLIGGPFFCYIFKRKQKGTL